jgi:hypothetical protein
MGCGNKDTVEEGLRVSLKTKLPVKISLTGSYYDTRAGEDKITVCPDVALLCPYIPPYEWRPERTRLTPK